MLSAFGGIQSKFREGQTAWGNPPSHRNSCQSAGYSAVVQHFVSSGAGAAGRLPKRCECPSVPACTVQAACRRLLTSSADFSSTRQRILFALIPVTYTLAPHKKTHSSLRCCRFLPQRYARTSTAVCRCATALFAAFQVGSRPRYKAPCPRRPLHAFIFLSPTFPALTIRHFHPGSFAPSSTVAPFSIVAHLHQPSSLL